MGDHFVVLDCDMGADDAWALLTLIKAETVLNLFKILAITSVAGNTNVGNVTQNIYRMLDSLHRTDIPIYKGCAEAFIPYPEQQDWFGVDGFGDVLPKIPPNIEYIHKGHAVNRMYELASKISFIQIGPLTNLATCIIMYNDFLDKVKDIWILGTHLNTSTRADFNFRTDAVAAHVVLEHADKVPVYILPSDPTREANKGIDLKYRFDYLGSVDSPTINMLNKVEKSIFPPKNRWIANDAFLTAAFMFPEKMIVKSGNFHAEVEVGGNNTGLTLRDHSGKQNVLIIEQLNADNYKWIIAWAAGVSDAKILPWNPKKLQFVNKVADKCSTVFPTPIFLAFTMVLAFMFK